MDTHFVHHNILTSIRYTVSENLEKEPKDVIAIMKWLGTSPKYATFRINLLRNHFNSEKLKQTLIEQNKELNCSNLPNFYLLRPDCLVVECWPKTAALNSSRKEVIVDAACGAAVLRGAHVYAPGVMGMASDLKLEEIVDVYSDLTGSCKRGLKITFEGKKILVGKGKVKLLRADIFEKAEPSGIAIHIILPESHLPVINESLYPVGATLLQNLPSIICGWVLDAKPNERILDMCAAPGNKTTHLAEMSGNLAQIIALDKTIQKVSKIKENCEKHGITCVQSYVYDSTKSLSDTSKGINEGPPFPKESFDKILLDAPCSGLGQRPQLRNKMTVKELQSYKFLQRKLFETAVNLVKIGGSVVYSTCSVSQDENEGLVRWALDKYSCKSTTNGISLKLVAAEPLLGGPGWEGCGLSQEERLMVQRFGPEQDPLRPTDEIYRDTIGFFIASFVRKQ